MHCSQESVAVVRPGTPCVSVTELSGSGRTNPTPIVNEEYEVLLELYLSPEKLKDLTGVEDLRGVTTLEMCVDTRENTLGNFGSYLPSLVHLRMNNSLVMSVRDLGTTLSHLQVLWLARCGLADLDGIPSFSSLQELYVAYNDISDLSQVSMLEQLQVLDLEGNGVDDLIQVQYLGLCGHLSHLTLEGNPVCTQPRPLPGPAQAEQYDYRSAVRELVPQLRYLDNVPAGDVGPRCSSATVEEWDLLKESIKDSAPAGVDSLGSVSTYPRPGSAQRPATTLPLGRPPSARLGSSPASRPGSSPASRPGSSPASRPGSSPASRPGSAESDPVSQDQDASGLTHGVGRVICGNPVQVLRACRQKMGIPAPVPRPSPLAPPRSPPERTFDLEESDGRERSDVLSELRAWRKEHSRRLQAIEKERQPQVMKISHSDEDEGEEEEGMGRSLSFTSEDEEEEEGGRAGFSHFISTASPDSSFTSPLPDLLYEREAVSPEISRLSLSPDLSLSPSPPLALTVPPGGQGRVSALRARRLRVRGPAGGQLRAKEEPGAERGGPWEELEDEVNSMTLRPRSEASLRPASSPPVHGPRASSAEAGGICRQPISRHQPVIRSLATRAPEGAGPPLLTRPLTARAALQRLPNRLELSHRGGTSPCRPSR